MAGTMASFAETLLLSTIMGLSIFISLPIVLHKRTSDMANRLLLAAAIGILVFIMADVWGDATPGGLVVLAGLLEAARTQAGR